MKASLYLKIFNNQKVSTLWTQLTWSHLRLLFNLEIDSINQPAIMIIDSDEGLMNLEFLKQIKQIQAYANTKVIVTSNTHNKTEILDAGADLYLPKPYEISDLIRWVEYFLK